MADRRLIVADVQGDVHEIFVFFVQEDDGPIPESDKGWVSTLLDAVSDRVGQVLGKKDAYRIVKAGPGTGDIPDEALGIVVLSSDFLGSEWRGENQPFLANIEARNLSGAITRLVERENIAYAERPRALRNLSSYRFWVPGEETAGRVLNGLDSENPDYMRYYRRVDDLARDLAGEIRGKQPTPGVEKLETREVLIAGQIRKAFIPPPEEASHVFICHAREDEEPARRMYADLLFTLRLPTHPPHPIPLWDFDFRCTPTGCWIVVPLTRGKVVVYRMENFYEER